MAILRFRQESGALERIKSGRPRSEEGLLSSANMGLTVSERAAVDFASRVLAAVGVSPEACAVVASNLVWAESRGLSSHGLQRLDDYTERVESGSVAKDARPAVVRASGATAVVDGCGGQGQPAFELAAETAVGLAREAGVGWVAVGNCSHAGALGYYTHRIAEEGLIGVAVISSRPNMGYPGARRALVGTNPIAVTVPVGGEMVSVDVSPAAITRGRLKQHRRDGLPLPEGVAVDGDGNPVTDPEQAITVVPIGGAKGGVLALIFEFLAGILAGFPVLGPAINGREDAPLQGGSVVAVDPSRFGDPDVFLRDATELVDAIRTAEPVTNGIAVRVPGDRAAELARSARTGGLTLDGSLVARLELLAQRLHVTPLGGGQP